MREYLKKAREEKGLTKRKAAELSGISESYYNLIESGKRGAPVPTAKKIAEALGFDWQVFYDGKTDKPA